MPLERLKTHLANEQWANCYIVYGEESYFIDEIGQWFEQKIIDQDYRDFNQSILYGSDLNMGQVLERARQLPMMYSRTLVLVRQAQSLTRQLNELEDYLKQPNNQCVLVFLMHSSSLDRRKKVVKEIERQEGLIECKKLYENEVAAWLEKELVKLDLSFMPEAKQLFLAVVGNDPNRLMRELQKIKHSQNDIRQVDVQHIEKQVGVHRTFNVFELQKALSQGMLEKASSILAFFSANAKDHPIQMTLPVLFSFFSKVFKYHALKNKAEAPRALGVSPYFIKDYQSAAKHYSMKRLTVLIAELKRIDLQSKGVGQLASPNLSIELYQALIMALVP